MTTTGYLIDSVRYRPPTTGATISAKPRRTMAPVEIRDLCKHFGGVAAVNHLSFDIEPGRVTGFLGPNGAGKSTTLRALLGLVQPSSGSATFGGLRYDELDEPSAVWARCSRTPPSIRVEAHETTCGSWPSRETIPPTASRRSCPRSGSATPPTGV